MEILLDYGTATLKQVRITPCPEALNRRPCILKKGTDVQIEVDFIPSMCVPNWENYYFYYLILLFDKNLTYPI